MNSRSVVATAVVVLAAGVVFAPAQAVGPVAPATVAQGERFPADARVARHAETGKVTFVAMEPGRPDARPPGVASDTPPAAVGKAYLERHAGALGLGGPSAVTVMDQTPGVRGGTSVRYQQTLAGIEVLGGEFVVHLDANRNIVSLNGEAAPAGGSFDAKPKLSASQAEAAALATVAKSERVRVGTLRATGTTLKVFDPRVLGGPGLPQPTLVYATTVWSRRDLELSRLVLVHADQGYEMATIDETHEAKNRSICDAGNTAAQVPCTAPVLTEGGTYSGPAADVNPAYIFSGATYDFFKNRFNRDSLDGQGLPLKSTVRYCDPAQPCPFANAFWSSQRQQMVYGDTYASADDVVGHELAHGFTEFTSNLFYYYESGAINESLSDVFGEFVDLTTPSAGDAAADRWKIGESLPIGAIRDMRTPGSFGDPDRMGSLNYWTFADDSGGVHINSGVNNKAAYLMTDGGAFNGFTVSSLGLDKVARLYYVVNTEYLTSGSDYRDLGRALGTACDLLVGTAGFTAGDCVEVRDAVAATEMLTIEGVATDQPACPSGQSPIYAFFDNMEGTTPLWSSSVVSGSFQAWSYSTGYTTSGTRVLYGLDEATTSDSAMAMTTPVFIPAGASLRLRHAYQFEEGGWTYYDGGVIEWSENNGASWNNLPSPGYTGFLSSSDGNPLAGRRAYAGTSGGFYSESIPLSDLAGKSVRFRFRIGTDELVGDIGWIIDDVGIHQCGVDSTAPNTTLSGGPAEGSFTSATTANFTFSANEQGSTFECKLDAGPFGPCLPPQALTALGNGAHSYQVRAVDPAGNRDPSPATRTWTVDTLAPSVTISSPASNGVKVFDITPTFRFAANEPSTFDCYIDDVLKLTGCATGWTSGPLTQGAHTFKVIAADRAGHTTTTTRSFVVTPRFTIARTSKADEGIGADQIVVRRDGGNGTASVKVSTTLAGTAKSPADFAAQSITVTFTGTQASKTVPLSVVNDRLVEGTETIGVTLSNPVNGELPTPTRKVSLKDND